MDRIDPRILEQLLGIYRPWAIHSLDTDELSQTLHVYLEKRDKEKKKLFGLLETATAESTEHSTPGYWYYRPIAGYRCVIHANIDNTNNAECMTKSALQKPAFIGSLDRHYSNYIRQKVALSELQGQEAKAICQQLNLEENLYQQISQDLDKTEPTLKPLLYIPTENDAVWYEIIKDKQHLKTDKLPLKLLLAKLKLSASKAESGQALCDSAQQLHRFFINNFNNSSLEIDQICGFDSTSSHHHKNMTKSQQKLVLPSLKNVVWIDLITGKIKLNSQSMPLNLLVTRQRVAFLNGSSSKDKVKAIEIIRSYFLKNHRQLKPELVLLNRAMARQQRAVISLPNPDHDVWQRILANDEMVPSNHVAYKLLLSRLRSQVKQSADPVVRIEAAKRIRSFLHQNQRTMRRELNAIVKESAQAS